MGPEEGDAFKVEPGRIWMVPACVDMAEQVKAIKWDDDFSFDLEEYRGLDGGLDGGLQGWPDGARIEAYGGSTWNIQLEFDQEIPEETMAALLGLSVEAYRDLKRWVGEKARLERLTGLNWSLE